MKIIQDVSIWLGMVPAWARCKDFELQYFKRPLPLLVIKARSLFVFSKAFLLRKIYKEDAKSKCL